MRSFHLTLLVGVLVCGCHKQRPAANASSTSTNVATAPVAATEESRQFLADQGLQPLASPPPAEPLPPPPAYVATRAVNAVSPAVEGEVDPFLTSQLRSFVARNRRLPNSFSEFTSKALDSVPNPPPGKRWAIDASSLQVKSVR